MTMALVPFHSDKLFPSFSGVPDWSDDIGDGVGGRLASFADG